MSRLRPYRSDLLALLALFVLALLWFSPVLFPGLTGRTLLPYENLYTFEPWRSLQPGLIPHNDLLSDLVLENAPWKLHIRRALADGQLPLWNPQILTGLPFLAAGQASTFYPLNILFYVLPLELAYGWFTALQIGLAGANMYLLGRVLRLRPIAALLGGIVYMFSGFLIVSVVFTMFVAAAAWLPLLLAIIELVVRKQEEKGVARFDPIPYLAVGVAAIGLMVLAGHPELIYYTLLVAALYTVMRLAIAWRRLASAKGEPGPGAATRRLAVLAGWLLAMSALGIAAGSVQLIPLLELLPLNFRDGSASYADVVGWAWPSRHVLTFLIPDIFGNPSHHHWFDIWSGQWVAASVNALGETNQTIFWGIKNYVEGGNYLGIVTWLLAPVALVRALRRRSQQESGAPGPANGPIWFFAGLALLSLLFAFGTPLYKLLYYGLPGWDQLHSPFRWVFPFTLSMAILAAVGLQTLLDIAQTRESGRMIRMASSILAGLALIAGIGLLLMVGASIMRPTPFIELGERLLAASDLARMAFADGRMIWSYTALNLAKLGLLAAIGGLLVWLLVRGGRRVHWIVTALLVLVVVDLFVAHGRFNPASPVALSPLLPENRPGAAHFLDAQEGASGEQLWRFTTFNAPGDKTANANVGMYYGWHDLRGYDSIIPRQYVNLMDRIAPQANELLYNRIAPLYSNVGGDPYAVLDNPLLDLLNVRYVMTEHTVPNAEWQEVFRDEAVGIYENRQVFERAFFVPEARVAAVEEQPLTDVDLSRVVYIEEPPADANALVAASPTLADARISRYTTNDVFVDVNLSDRGWLVLADAYAPGWKAFIRPFGADESQEQELKILRANGALRSVYLPDDGQWTVRFVYSPMSFKLGLYGSFLAFMAVLLLLFYWTWGKYYRPETTEGDVRTVAKNSLVPMTLSLSNKAIDFAFAMLYVRLLGPEGTGKYYFVVAIYGFFEIISRYGLGTLLTRDVAADKNQSSRYLTNVMALRTLLWAVSMPVLALVTYGYTIVGQGPAAQRLGLQGIQVLAILTGAAIFTWMTFGIKQGSGGMSSRAVWALRVLIWAVALPLLALTGGRFAQEAAGSVQSIGRQEVQAIAILAIAMLFANWADGLSATFIAFEKMEYPAGLTNAAALLKVTLGALVLLLGWGFVGLAGVSLVINMLMLYWLYNLLRRTLFEPEWQWDWSLQKWMMRISGPLMINHLLATIFWRIDVWILRPLAGAASVGLYSVGLKYLDGLNIIPSVFTMAIFPLMSRYAKREGDSLLRSYTISLRLLVMVSLPIALMVTFVAEPLVQLVGGAQYLNVPETVSFLGRKITFLGGSDLALQVIIWSIPIGFVNSVTQFVLIAVNQQRFLTKAFIIGVVFNVIGNLLLIPHFGYLGAACITIFSEFSLLFPFYYSVKRNVGVVPWLSICLRPTLALVVTGIATYGLTAAGLNVWLAVGLGLLIYGGLLALTGALRGNDMELVWGALPLPFLRNRGLNEAGS